MDQVYRKEIKYLISNLEFCRLRKRLECFVQPDPYSGDTGYQVRSLYFDSNDDQDLFDNLAGNMEKRKIRLRFYPPDATFIRLEYKCKFGSDGLKRSIWLSQEDAQLLMGGDYRPLIASNEPLALELFTRLSTGGYRPRVIVSYNRLAYTYPVSNTRINFDSAIGASYVTNSFFEDDLGLIPIMPPDLGVLEIKYDHFLVSVLKEVIGSLDASSRANSKYAQSRFLF